jgi:hypothetical protein
MKAEIKWAKITEKRKKEKMEIEFIEARDLSTAILGDSKPNFKIVDVRDVDSLVKAILRALSIFPVRNSWTMSSLTT